MHNRLFSYKYKDRFSIVSSLIMRFSAIVTAAVAFIAGAQAAVVDRQISVPVTVSCIIDDNIIDILKRWGEPTSTITSSASWTPVGTTSYTTATVTSTATPFGGYCPCDSTANKKRFIDERQISVPVEVTCTLDDNIVTVGTSVIDLLGEIL